MQKVNALAVMATPVQPTGKPPRLSQTLAQIPEALGSMVETVASMGFTVPERHRAYILDRSAADVAALRAAHTDYLCELFAAYGDPRRILPGETDAVHEVRRPAMEQARERLCNGFLAAGISLRDVPLLEKTFDPFARVHWELMLSADVQRRQEYHEHFQALAHMKYDFTHIRAVHSAGFDVLARCHTPRQLKSFLRTVSWPADAFGYDEFRSGRRHLVFSSSVSIEYDLVLVLEDLQHSGQALTYKAAYRLVSHTAKRVHGPGASFVFEVPLGEILPCAFIYERIECPSDLAIAVRFHTLAMVLLASAFQRVLGDIECRGGFKHSALAPAGGTQ